MSKLILMFMALTLLPDTSMAQDHLLAGGKRIKMTIEVNIVPDRMHFPHNNANVAGRYIHPGQIWVESATLGNGQITVDPHVLGHEVLHAINYRDGTIQNQDETTIWRHELN